MTGDRYFTPQSLPQSLNAFNTIKNAQSMIATAYVQQQQQQCSEQQQQQQQ
ncbi:unnamed protein product [Ceratitis capitata]|uniref:(Mediterranean fruit fly) hypothetical protein n=1 Tax=Ceratitis capitata TaxID=7213 RepID=A0A811UYP1_CERCA|nr:unnamed protein product [Ceratitis capitata]